MAIPDAYDYGRTEQAAYLNDKLENFYEIFDPHLDQLHHQLQKSWEIQTGKQPFALTRTVRYIPYMNIRQEVEVPSFSKTIRIRTSSEKKWNICGGIAILAGFIPVQELPTEDEEKFHNLIRTLDDEFPRWYPMMVAHAKQTFDLYRTPMLTLDTVTYVDGIPMEKPRNKDEAKQMIQRLSGKQVTTDTGWVVGMQLQSRATVKLLNSTRLTYTLKPFSESELEEYVETTPNIYGVAGAMNFATREARARYIDTTTPITLEAHSCFGQTQDISLTGDDLNVSIFNPIFAGVPVHAIRALLPRLHEIYLHGDPFAM